MKSPAFLLPLALLPGLAAPAVSAQRHNDQDAVKGRQNLVPLPVIEKRVVPMMRGSQYIGMAFDDRTLVYTLKFLRDDRVIWVDVDARTGQVIGRTGG